RLDCFSMSFTDEIKKIFPVPIWNVLKKIKFEYLKFFYLRGRRPIVAGESSKARSRREKENYFELYCKGKGLDIGFGGDLIVPWAEGWDFEDGDAQYLNGLENETFDFVYSSHTLEHVSDAGESLKNWWRVLKQGGYLLLYIPHRDLYEKKKNLPSRFNPYHLRFFLIDEEALPDTVGIIPLITRTLSNFEIIYAKECSEGHSITDTGKHSDGEYSIEVVVQKKIEC
ncbi:MAG: class I SAM-dependent methyltransferase, partial [Ignavibacteriaceae bacterium]|nr:class I SAM-dependent methyltransferase [Ignavibacteriaceae bacterium]